MKKNESLKNIMLKENYNKVNVESLINYMEEIGYEVEVGPTGAMQLIDAQTGEIEKENVSIVDVIGFAIDFKNNWIRCSGKNNLTSEELQPHYLELEQIKSLIQ